MGDISDDDARAILARRRYEEFLRQQVKVAHGHSLGPMIQMMSGHWSPVTPQYEEYYEDWPDEQMTEYEDVGIFEEEDDDEVIPLIAGASINWIGWLGAFRPGNLGF